MVRLHLGCGVKKFRGYINIDTGGTPDIECDITDLPYPEDYADEIMAIHVFEHMYPHRSVELLKHWRGILKPKGKLILEMPDLKKVLKHFAHEEKAKEDFEEKKKKGEVTGDFNPNMSMTMFALYGGVWSTRPEDTHKWCWTFDSIVPVLIASGFRDIVEKTAQYHQPERDFRVEATK